MICGCCGGGAALHGLHVGLFCVGNLACLLFCCWHASYRLFLSLHVGLHFSQALGAVVEGSGPRRRCRLGGRPPLLRAPLLARHAAPAAEQLGSTRCRCRGARLMPAPARLLRGACKVWRGAAVPRGAQTRRRPAGVQSGGGRRLADRADTNPDCRAQRGWKTEARGRAGAAAPEECLLLAAVRAACPQTVIRHPCKLLEGRRRLRRAWRPACALGMALAECASLAAPCSLATTS